MIIKGMKEQNAGGEDATCLTAAEIRNRKIIDAVLAREKVLCPGAIALIGIYGSFQTGDIHPLSDLDLLILINDERGWQLARAFILEDEGIGYDIYCTDRESLHREAAFEDPYISKLMESRIVYCADEKYRNELEALREQVRQKLSEPFSEADFRKAENTLKEAQHCYALAMMAEDPADVRKQAGGVLYFTENAIAMLNRTWFRLGTRRRYEELNAMEKRPEKLCELIENVLAADTVLELKDRLTLLVKGVTASFEKEKQAFRPGRKPADTASLAGTYEEMYSNWHGKMKMAAETGNRYLAFMSLVSLDGMMADICSETDIGSRNVLSVYDPGDLDKTAEGFDAVLQDYLQEYGKLSLKPQSYRDVDAFIDDYLSEVEHQL